MSSGYMTSSPVKLVLTLGIGLFSLQGMSCKDIDIDKGVQQSGNLETKNQRNLESQIEKLVTQVEKLVYQNEKLGIKNEKLTTKNENLGNQIEKLVTKNAKLVDQLSKKCDTKLLTSIASVVTNNSNTIVDIYNALVPPCADAPTWIERPLVTLSSGITVVCDTTTDNGGWVVFQRRTSDGVDFYQGWQKYKDGFGDKPNNFCLGLEAIHQLTNGGDYELRVDLKDSYNFSYYAQYDVFRVLGEDEKYKLEVSGYHGTARDSLTWHNGQYFSTHDRDNDSWDGNCAQEYHGAWWYRTGLHCHTSNLNGLWASGAFGKGLNWNHITGKYHSLTFSEMKFRPRRP